MKIPLLLCCTFVDSYLCQILNYVAALPLIILNMWPSINCSTLYATGSSPTCLHSLAPIWNLHGAFNINLVILFWVHSILHFNFFDNPLSSYTKLSRCNQNDIESKQIYSLKILRRTITVFYISTVCLFRG